MQCYFQLLLDGEIKEEKNQKQCKRKQLENKRRRRSNKRMIVGRAVKVN
jgi:hypothetical protein